MIELWIIYAIISAVAAGVGAIINRYVVKEHDWVSYASVTNILTGLLFVPLILSNFILPTTQYSWTILLVAIILWTVFTAVATISYQYTEVSLRSPLVQVKTIFVLILSYLLLAEALTMNKIFGTLLVFAGSIVLTMNKGRLFGRLDDLGVRLSLLSAFLISIVSIVDKVAMRYWDPAVYSFFVYLIPGITIGLFTIKRKDKLFRMMRLRSIPVLLVSILGFVYYLFRLKAFSLADISVVYPVLRISVLVGVFGGIVLLKERKDVLQKIIGTIVMLIGIMFVSGYW